MRERLYIPGSTKVASALMASRAFGQEGRLVYHTSECHALDPVIADPIAVWEHASVGRYVINPRDYSRREAAECKPCQRLASGTKPKRVRTPEFMERKRIKDREYRRSQRLSRQASGSLSQ